MERTPVRTYIYYSDDKILQLEQQLPLASWWRRALRRIRGVNAGIPGGPSMGVDIGVREQIPILRTMQTVWRYLDEERLVGSFDEPKQFFYGQLEFYYGDFDNANPPVWFLVGATDQTIVALGGSKKHLRGFRDQDVRPSENARSVTMEPDVATLIYTAEAGSSGAPINAPSAAPDQDLWATHVALIHSNWQFQKGKKMMFEVLARREGMSRVSGPPLESPKDVLIGSPIFVAQT